MNEAEATLYTTMLLTAKSAFSFVHSWFKNRIPTGQDLDAISPPDSLFFDLDLFDSFSRPAQLRILSKALTDGRSFLDQIEYSDETATPYLLVNVCLLHCMRLRQDIEFQDLQERMQSLEDRLPKY